MGRKIKAVYFNPELEAELLAFAQSLPNFSEWVKGRIRREIEIRKTGIDLELEELVDRMLETKLAGRIVAPGQEESKADVSELVEAFF